eukprot:c11634_g1_i1.p1 GENE.c11634_g1_i1~~c11634_g1_i1.p1  ORF type:complete len:443 (-),score=131.52 c11634_g1_i1:276-1520(-)
MSDTNIVSAEAEPADTKPESQGDDATTTSTPTKRMSGEARRTPNKDNFQIGELVMAKCHSFPFWPGQVVPPEKMEKGGKLKKTQVVVQFFGPVVQFAWITAQPKWLRKLSDQDISQPPTRKSYKEALDVAYAQARDAFHQKIFPPNWDQPLEHGKEEVDVSADDDGAANSPDRSAGADQVDEVVSDGVGKASTTSKKKAGKNDSSREKNVSSDVAARRNSDVRKRADTKTRGKSNDSVAKQTSTSTPAAATTTTAATKAKSTKRKLADDEPEHTTPIATTSTNTKPISQAKRLTRLRRLQTLGLAPPNSVLERAIENGDNEIDVADVPNYLLDWAQVHASTKKGNSAKKQKRNDDDEKATTSMKVNDDNDGDDAERKSQQMDMDTSAVSETDLHGDTDAETQGDGDGNGVGNDD